MTTLNSRLHAVQPTRPSAEIPNPLTWIRNVILGLEGRRQRDAAVAVLHGLDNRTLRDIGVERSEIASLVYGDDTDRTDRAA